ncbi:hypothetical protein BHM03_00003567, partial [Ensete ventricosum]
GRTADLTQVRSAPPTCKRTPHCKDNKHGGRVRRHEGAVPQDAEQRFPHVAVQRVAHEHRSLPPQRSQHLLPLQPKGKMLWSHIAEVMKPGTAASDPRERDVCVRQGGSMTSESRERASERDGNSDETRASNRKRGFCYWSIQMLL